jgi:hypothetical protein
MGRLPILVALAMLAVLAACGSKPKSKPDGNSVSGPIPLASAEAVPVGDESSQAPGHVKIWMPSGIVGNDRSWIYINGRIARGSISGDDNAGPKSFVASQAGEEWFVFDTEGVFLRTSHGEWTGLDHYLQSGDRHHIFQPVDLTLAPGKYRIEAAFHTLSGTFPFLFGRPYDVEIQSGAVTQVYPGLPEGLVTVPILRAEAVDFQHGLCSRVKPAPPDISRLEDIYARFNNDPVVKALEEASATHSPSDKAVSLDLPADMGGVREFDGTQIGIIAGASADKYSLSSLPTPQDVATCTGYFPQFSAAYAAYRKPIDVIEEEFESFRKLGRDLNAGQ